MKNIYLFLVDKAADFEHGYLAELLSLQNMRGKKDFNLVTVALTKQAVKTSGGLTIIPDISVDEIDASECGCLVLIGGDTWQSGDNGKILEIAKNFLEKGILVAAICGATLALSDEGMLNEREHTSNGLGFLKQFSKNYSGEKFYKNELCVKDGNLITSSCAGAMKFARIIAEALGIFKKETLDAWEDFFKTGNESSFFTMYQTLQN